MDEVRIEIPHEVAIELVKKFGFGSFTKNCKIEIKSEPTGQYVEYKSKKLLVGMTQNLHCFLVIEDDEKMGKIKIYEFLNGLTVAELKRVLEAWPDTDNYGLPTEVWIETGENLSSPVNSIWPLNAQENSADILFKRTNG